MEDAAMNTCQGCQFYQPFDVPATIDILKKTEQLGMCFGEPPRNMLLPYQGVTPVLKPGPQQMSMQVQSMRPNVMSTDRACALYVPAVKQ
jgi:hypothetical protein